MSISSGPIFVRLCRLQGVVGDDFPRVDRFDDGSDVEFAVPAAVMGVVGGVEISAVQAQALGQSGIDGLGELVDDRIDVEFLGEFAQELVDEVVDAVGSGARG